MGESTFKLQVKIPKRVRLRERELDRELFSQWLWERYLSSGLLGVHEGTLLSDEAADLGLETDSWTLDAAEAPRERDWIAGQKWNSSELYFTTAAQAEAAARELRSATNLEVGQVTEQESEDWDAKWKASFLGSEQGVSIPPNWRILPPWVSRAAPDESILRINPGAGFGTGTHETTQLCLRAIAEAGIRPDAAVLDFGSGSGILAIGAALLGARVDAVEIDPLAIDNAVENAKLNRVEGSIRYSRALPEKEIYRVVIANILRPVLLEFSEKLVQRLGPGGTLILSGLIEKDVREVAGRYGALLGGGAPERRALGEWRALVWKRAGSGSD